MQLTKQKPWSKTIQQQRIKWLGHALRLSENTPCRQAMNEFTRQVKRPRGHSNTIWYNLVKKNLNKKM